MSESTAPRNESGHRRREAGASFRAAVHLLVDIDIYICLLLARSVRAAVMRFSFISIFPLRKMARSAVDLCEKNVVNTDTSTIIGRMFCFRRFVPIKYRNKYKCI